MREELYHKIYDRYLKKCYETRKEIKAMCRFQDIAANLLVSCDYFINNDRKLFIEYIHALRDYFRLLEKYPEFKSDELSKLGGHFPEFGAFFNKANFNYKAAGFSSYLSHYVAYSKKRLEDMVGTDS